MKEVIGMCNYLFKEVYYDQYCKTCRFEKIPEDDENCDYCLDHPVNEHSHKPVNWKPKDNSR